MDPARIKDCLVIPPRSIDCRGSGLRFKCKMLGSYVVDRFRGVASCRQLRHCLELGESGPAGRLGAAAILKRGPAARRN